MAAVNDMALARQQLSAASKRKSGGKRHQHNIIKLAWQQRSVAASARLAAAAAAAAYGNGWRAWQHGDICSRDVALCADSPCNLICLVF